MINETITAVVRREFSRSLRFEAGRDPFLPPARKQVPRLLYLHVPFCEKLCPYCSFNRFLFDASLGRRYFQALRQEMGLYRDRGYDFAGVYVGGGTPTVMIDELAATLETARDHFSVREISVETNPNHLTEDRLAILKAAGVNRLSVGIQSFDDGLLEDMDRREKYGSGEEIAGRLAGVGGRFDTLNADMIFNFPSQTQEILIRDLDTLLRIGVDQVTYYPLMVSDSTRRQVAEKLGKVDYGREERYYSLILRQLLPVYRHSSAWCFSRQQGMIDEYIVDYDEYAGLGSGSIGFLDGACYANTFNVAEYIERIGRGELPLMAARVFGKKDQLRYDFLMKLFGTRLDLQTLREKYGVDPWRYLWFEITAFLLAGCLRYDGGRLSLTDRGCYSWVIMMREFFIAVNNFRDFCRARLPGCGADGAGGTGVPAGG
ncbi:MAG TPA: coproporphyrinogen III oxidase family protein [Syntrophales bacterium]|nr:coproporphyrinogen III oxidase family protein [Syntrophales bacterium]